MGHVDNSHFHQRKRQRTAPEEDLVVMLTDVEDQPGGAVRLFGVDAHATRSVCINALGYAPNFWLPAPLMKDPSAPQTPAREPTEAEIRELRRLMNLRWAPQAGD